MNCNELYRPSLSGRVRIFEKENPDKVLFDEKNLILNGTSWLFSQLLFDHSQVSKSVWGLAIGQGESTWDENLPDPVATDYSILYPFYLSSGSQIPLRIALSSAQTHFIDPITLQATTWSTTVDFQTNISTTIYPELQGQKVRELGLIGGISPDSFSTSPFFNPSVPDQDSVILVNLKRFQGLQLPDGVNFIISWNLSF